jgi:hypothetical protein
MIDALFKQTLLSVKEFKGVWEKCHHTSNYVTKGN